MCLSVQSLVLLVKPARIQSQGKNLMNLILITFQTLQLDYFSPLSTGRNKVSSTENKNKERLCPKLYFSQGCPFCLVLSTMSYKNICLVQILGTQLTAKEFTNSQRVAVPHTSTSPSLSSPAQQPFGVLKLANQIVNFQPSQWEKALCFFGIKWASSSLPA